MAAARLDHTARVRALEESRARFDHIAEEALVDRSWVAAVNATKQALDCDREIGKIRATLAARSPDVLLMLERSAELALADGSYGPAAGMMRDAAEMRAQREAARREQEERDGRAKDWPGMLQALGEQIDRMPLPAREQLLTLVRDRCSRSTG